MQEHWCTDSKDQQIFFFSNIAVYKRGNQVNSFLISPQKIYVKVLMLVMNTDNMFFRRNKTNINTV